MKTLKKIAGKSARILLNQVLKNPSCRNIAVKQAEKLIYKSTMKDISYPEAVREEVFENVWTEEYLKKEKSTVA